MFNLSHPKAQNESWAADPMLFTDKGGDKHFNDQDWDNVPKVAYETALFRKLAPPRMARVVTNPGSFVLETYGAPTPKPTPAKAHDLQAQHPKKDGGSIIAAKEDLGIDLTAKVDSVGAKNPTDLEGLGASAAESSRELDDEGAKLDAASIGALQGQEPSGPENEIQDPTSTETNLKSPGSSEQIEHERAPSDELSTLESSHEGTHESSQSFDEGYQLGLLKGIEKAHAEALEEFAVERDELQAQVGSLKSQLGDVQEREIAMQAKVDELSKSLEEQQARLETEREALRQENSLALESQKKLLEEVTSKLDDFVNHPQRLFEPLKRLSVHIAEQLVLAELNLSGASIERLIQRCLDEISSHSNQAVTVELNTQDKARLQELTGEMFSHIQLHAVSSLQPGSVRVITDDTQVDDLIGHRLEAMANNLLAQPELWREQSPFFKQPLAQRDTDIEDVRQRLTPMVERHEEDQDD